MDTKSDIEKVEKMFANKQLFFFMSGFHRRIFHIVKSLTIVVVVVVVP